MNQRKRKSPTPQWGRGIFFSRASHEPRQGMTFAEVMIASVVLLILFAGVFRLFQTLYGKKAAGISQRLELQMEARRALINLYGEIQEGIELLKPEPGVTLPFMAIRDSVNNVHFIFQKKDAVASERQKRDIFRLYTVVYDIERNVGSQPREIMTNVERLNFTAHGYGGVVVTSDLKEGEASFSFVNMIRLKNALAEEGS